MENRYAEAIVSLTHTVTLDLLIVEAWYFKGIAEERVGRAPDAADSYKQFLALHPTRYLGWEVPEIAHQRLRELEGK